LKIGKIGQIYVRKQKKNLRKSQFIYQKMKKNCQRKTIGLKMKPIQKDILHAL